MMKNTREKIFTGQIMDENENVVCPKCNKLVNVRSGWIDPYNKNKYVHYKCLSNERMNEIKVETK
jgi:hypothetical protein